MITKLLVGWSDVVYCISDYRLGYTGVTDYWVNDLVTKMFTHWLLIRLLTKLVSVRLGGFMGYYNFYCFVYCVTNIQYVQYVHTEFARLTSFFHDLLIIKKINNVAH